MTSPGGENPAPFAPVRPATIDLGTAVRVAVSRGRNRGNRLTEEGVVVEVIIPGALAVSRRVEGTVYQPLLVTWYVVQVRDRRVVRPADRMVVVAR